MNKKRISKLQKSVFLFIFVFLTSILIGVLIILDTSKPDHYNILPLLPLSFAITSIFFINLYRKCFDNLSIAIIIGGYYMRNVLDTFFMFLGNYKSMFLVKS